MPLHSRTLLNVGRESGDRTGGKQNNGSGQLVTQRGQAAEGKVTATDPGANRLLRWAGRGGASHCGARPSLRRCRSVLGVARSFCNACFAPFCTRPGSAPARRSLPHPARLGGGRWFVPSLPVAGRGPRGPGPGSQEEFPSRLAGRAPGERVTAWGGAGSKQTLRQLKTWPLTKWGDSLWGVSYTKET